MNTDRRPPDCNKRKSVSQIDGVAKGDCVGNDVLSCGLIVASWSEAPRWLALVLRSKRHRLRARTL
jgi:hypothetical protein